MRKFLSGSCLVLGLLVLVDTSLVIPLFTDRHMTIDGRLVAYFEAIAWLVASMAIRFTGKRKSTWTVSGKK